MRFCHLNELSRMIDRDVDQTALTIEHRFEGRVVAVGDSHGTSVLLRLVRINPCVTIEARAIQHAAVAYGPAEIVERESPDHAVVVIDEETRAQSVVEAFLDGGEDALRSPANERENFVGAGQR